MRAVKVGANEAIEKAVVPVGELLLGGIGRASKPIDKALRISSILVFAICMAYPPLTLMVLVSKNGNLLWCPIPYQVLWIEIPFTDKSIHFVHITKNLLLL